MSRTQITSEGRIRRSAFFVLLGLASEVLSLYWRHPLSFFLFAVAGALLGLLGILSFLLALISPHERPESFLTETEDAA